MAFFGNVSPQWLEALFRQWQQCPHSVAADWRAFFEGFLLGSAAEGPPGAGGSERASMDRHLAVDALIHRYRDLGHLLACTDPLSSCPVEHPLLALSGFGLEQADLDLPCHPREFSLPGASLGEILQVLRETYCRSIGVEYLHMQQPDERTWLQERMEGTRNRRAFSREEQENILGLLQRAALFERFLHRQFPGQKRFSLEGGEVLIPLLETVVQRAAAGRVSDIIVGMPHRGRLNVLSQIFGKPLANIFAEFRDNLEYGEIGEGDIKYHKGYSSVRELAADRRVALTLASNPSHLEAVDPVVEGKARARQDALGKAGAGQVLPVLIHGDAAFAGQGIVAETLNLSQLEGYRTGGTLHIVLNNQIGFTTRPADARSTCYATDVAKMLMAPIFHVHGENPEAVVYAAELALEYRQRFGGDVLLEIICYRRHGHSEEDEPSFTQPLMVEKIRQRPPVDELYAAELCRQGLAEERVAGNAAAIRTELEEALATPPQPPAAGFAGKWRDIAPDYRPWREATGVPADRLMALAAQLTTLPEGFRTDERLLRLLEKRRAALSPDGHLDWAMAEALAFASLLAEGHDVRLSGQDSRRGTFSQRHAALVDVTDGRLWVPLAATAARGARCSIYDSTLSEAAILGFEYGYSLESPNGLILWEAQFGDFANGAQVIIDQFVVSGAHKWQRASGLTLLLPHGYEGQGPEHSSARIERFLQSCARDNLQVVQPTTPAQLFHVLRRQLQQPFRRPLVVFTPKSLLRHPGCVSSLQELVQGRFEELLVDAPQPEAVRTVLLCSGKIYYELRAARENLDRQDVSLVRIEQFYPLQGEALREVLKGFPAAAKWVWVQEEPRNMGAWQHVAALLHGDSARPLLYVGREPAAAPAGGSHRQFRHEQERIVAAALAVEQLSG